MDLIVFALCFIAFFVGSLLAAYVAKRLYPATSEQEALAALDADSEGALR